MATNSSWKCAQTTITAKELGSMSAQKGTLNKPIGVWNWEKNWTLHKGFLTQPVGLKGSET